jgi:hypothetical protein
LVVDRRGRDPPADGERCERAGQLFVHDLVARSLA